MKNVIKNIKNSKGFVSIESILVIGAIVILSGVILFFFNGKATEVKDGAKDQVQNTQDAMQLPNEAANTDLDFTETQGI